MEIAQALSILAQAAEIAPLPKAGHIQVDAALKALVEFIKEHTAEEE